ncbi:hypothetical protein V3W47_06620 [Deinococcus sp. YIM 134068]|uniref:hypothetical protein n=1 Tax=Deinococcus lichenicola TaxID=3118910 RepID=UPI002F920C80
MRSFVWILVGFLAFVGILIAVFSWQGRAAREYGLEAVRAAQERNLTPGGEEGLNCAEILNRLPPEPVERCVVGLEDGKLTATLTLEGNRVFRVSP